VSRGNVFVFCITDFSDLRLSSPLKVTLPDLHAYIRSKNLPVVSIIPSSQDVVAQKMWLQFTNALLVKSLVSPNCRVGILTLMSSQVMSVPIGQPSKGIVLFAPPSSQPASQPVIRLLGIVCMVSYS
jgi:hypothetical protein